MLKITVDAAPLLRALDGLPHAVQAAILEEAAWPTAEAIASRARGLVAVRTGRTRAGIRAERGALAAFVISTRRPMPNVPIWLERGTRRMVRRPYLSIAAVLEESAWLARVRAAVERASGRS